MVYVPQALPQWPNTVCIGTKPTQSVGNQQPKGSRMGRAVAAVRQRTLGSQPQLGDHVQALWTGYKSVITPDQQLLDRCAPGNCCYQQLAFSTYLFVSQFGMHYGEYYQAHTS